jgi:hypothetical protein
MIDKIHSQTPNWIHVSYTDTLPYPTSSHETMQGTIRVAHGRLEYYSSGTWMQLPQNLSNVSLSGPAVEALQWAHDKRNQELRLKELATAHPAVADAAAAVQSAQDRLQVVLALTQENT